MRATRFAVYRRHRFSGILYFFPSFQELPEPRSIKPVAVYCHVGSIVLPRRELDKPASASSWNYSNRLKRGIPEQPKQPRVTNI